MYKLLILLFVIFFSELSALQTITVNDKTKEINLSPNSEVFFDSQSVYSYQSVCQDVFNDNFVPIKSESVSAGYTNDTIWTRFSITNDDEKTFNGSLEIPLPWINKLDVYIQKGETLSVKKLGASLPYDKREISSSSFFIPITLEFMESATVYIKAQGTNAITLAPHLYSHKRASERITYIAIFNGALIGMIVIMFLYNLHMYLTLGEENYLYYVLYLTGLLFFVGAYYGYNLQIVWSESPGFNEAISAPIVAFSFFSAMLFSRNFLKSSEHFPRFDKYLSMLMYSFIALGIFSLMIDSRLIIVYATGFLITLSSIALIYISAKSIYKKISGSRYFLPAWVIFTISLLLSSAMVQGFVEYDCLLYESFGIGVAANILLLSFALVDRSKQLREEREEAVKKEHTIVESLNESKDELEHLKERLERKVNLQTEQLKEKEHELENVSIKDEMTSLYNKDKLDELLSNELHRSKRYNDTFSLIIINIDGLKNINDTHSFQVGNSVIKEMADVLISNIRYIDVVGRWSQNEYLIICPETDSDQALMASHHIKKAIEEYKFFFVGSVTVSFGVTASKPTDLVKDLVRRAYKGLAIAKKSGGDRVEVVD